VTVHLPPSITSPGIVSYEAGTRRVVTPDATLTTIAELIGACGITRVANVTGLDEVGIPVAVACRPNSRALAVSQGKGLTWEAAKASAVMESIESWHAERISAPILLGRRHDLVRDVEVIPPELLPQVAASRYTDRLRIPWIEGHDLMTGRATWVPYELVHLDLTLPLPEGSGCFPLGSNGLASGNHPAESTLHALCELIERDAYALWYFMGDTDRSERRVDLSTVTSPTATDLVGRFVAAGLEVALWDITTDVGVAAYRCAVSSGATSDLRPLYPSSGLGCHPSREVAVVRALTEAAQSRLTRIAGSRDDVPRDDYELTRLPDELDRLHRVLRDEPQRRPYGAAPDFTSSTIADDIVHVTELLVAAGFEHAVIVDLSRGFPGVSVARAVVPGLETKPGGSGYRPGSRVRDRLEGTP
jgi:YcaO-like protein with predicted kinase domain